LIAYDRLSNAITNRKSKSAIGQRIGQKTEDKELVAAGNALPPNLLKALVFPYAILSLHENSSLQNFGGSSFIKKLSILFYKIARVGAPQFALCIILSLPPQILHRPT
jgi:hypothetical protein